MVVAVWTERREEDLRIVGWGWAVGFLRSSMEVVFVTGRRETLSFETCGVSSSSSWIWSAWSVWVGRGAKSRKLSMDVAKRSADDSIFFLKSSFSLIERMGKEGGLGWGRLMKGILSAPFFWNLDSVSGSEVIRSDQVVIIHS